MKILDYHIKAIKASAILFYLFTFTFIFMSDVNSQIIWTGNVNSDWENPNNWQGMLPINGNDIIIDSVSNYTGSKSHPNINIQSSFIPNKINIKKGGKLFIANNLTTTRDIKIDNGISTNYQTYINMSSGTLNITGDRSIKVRNGSKFILTGGTINITKDLSIETGSIFTMSGISNILINSDNGTKGRLKIKSKGGNNPILNLQNGTIIINSGDSKSSLELDGKAQGNLGSSTLNITGGTFINLGNTIFKKSTTDNTPIIINGGVVTLVDSIKVAYRKGFPIGCLKIKVNGGILNIQDKIILEGLDSLIQTGGVINFNNINPIINNGTIYCNGGITAFQGYTTLLGSSLNWQFHNVIINGSLIQTDPLNINISGDFTNNGTFVHNNKTITFNNSFNPQSIQTSTPIELYNIIVNSVKKVTIIAGMVNLRSSLTLTNGIFNANRLLTILSDSLGTSRISEITGGTIIGDVIIQRYINAGSTNWRFLTSAIIGTTLSQFNDDFITSGFTGSDFPLWPTPSNPWSSIYFYNELTPGIQDSGFVAATNVTNNLSIGEGLWIWCGDTITGTQPFTIDMVGPVNTGNINLPVTYTNSGLPTEDGWNMVGNPYPSSIDWDSPNITKVGIDNAIYIWNPDMQQFASYISGIGINGGSNNIASSQAFWVKANSISPNIQVSESIKTQIDASFLKQSTTLVIDVSSFNGSDQTIINFEENATNNFDNMYDALKMISVDNVPSISTSIDSIDLSINQLPEQEINIPLKITTTSSGIHHIFFTKIPNYCLILEDLFTGNIYDLNLNQPITTFIYDTTKTARFVIKFRAKLNITSTNVSCFGGNDGKIVINKNSSNLYDVLYKDNLGNVISNNSNIIVSDSIENLSTGTYIIETTDLTCGNNIDTISISEPNEIISKFTSDVDTTYLTNGGNITFTNQSSNANYYNWHFDAFNTSTLTSPTHQFTQVGNYFIILNAYQNPTCYKTSIKDIYVLGSINSIKTNSIDNEELVFIKDNKLFIKSIEIDKIEIKNILGQTLFKSNNKNNIFNLGNLQTQILIISIISEGHEKSFKLLYLK